MNFFKSNGNQSKKNGRQPRNNQGRNANQRSDYHDARGYRDREYESASSEEDSEDLLVFEWSKVI